MGHDRETGQLSPVTVTFSSNRIHQTFHLAMFFRVIVVIFETAGTMDITVDAVSSRDALSVRIPKLELSHLTNGQNWQLSCKNKLGLAF